MPMRIVYVAIQSADPSTMAEPLERLRAAGIETEFYGINSDDADDDVLVYQELARRTEAADFVFVRCMADTSRFHRFDGYEEALRGCRGYVFVSSGSLDVTMLRRDLFRGSDGDFMQLRRYAAARGPENDLGLLMYAARLLGETDAEPPAPAEQREDGVYHGGFPRDIGAEEYVASLDPGKVTVGIMFPSALWIYDNLAHIDALTEELERRGANTIPIFYSGVSYNVDGQAGSAAAVRRYFTKDGRPLVDALIVTNGFSVLNSSKTGGGVGVRDEENFFKSLLDVPVLFAMSVTGEYRDFEDDKVGMDKRGVQQNAAFPELDGDIDCVPISYTPKKTGMKRAVPIPERIERMCDYAMRWASLRRRPTAERRVAILMWQSRPSSGVIGNAAGLDTPESVAAMLRRLSEEGYQVEGVPEDGRELVQEILDNVTNDLDNVSPSYLRERAADLVPKGAYARQYSGIPEWDREMTEKDWGEPPGTVCVDGEDIVIPGIVKGNVFVGYQPLRGWAEKMEQNVHDPELFAQHQYIAFYRWLKETFKADMVFHMGTHGTLEWLPGKNVGLSAKCEPDLVLDGLINIYPYIVDDPGEGIQAKRRSSSVLVGHMPPSMARADSYEELDRVDVPLQDYLRLRATASPDRLDVLVSQIYDAAKENGLFNDLGITEDPGARGFADYIIPLHEYLTEVRDALVRADLHVLGRAPEGTHLDETVYSLMRLDNGGVRSLRDSFADNMGIDIRYALDHPAECFVSGEVLGAAAERADSELRGFITWMREDGFDAERSLAQLRERYGGVRDDLAEGVRYVCGKLAPNIARTADEMENMVAGLNGGYVLPGPSGAPTRGNADILPMGRNYYSLDPSTVPNRSAWEMGKRMADAMVEKYAAEKGAYPREIGFIIWATDTMKTGGDDMAYILWLMGVRPVWSKTGGQVVGLEAVPLEELGRPRIDVTVNITGLFRDTFPNLIDMIDDAVKLVAGLDEADEDNALAANLRRDIVDGIAAGLTPDEARRRNSVRVFGAPPGAYGTGVNKMIEASSWKTVEDIADVYVDWCSNGYAKGDYGQKMRDEFVRRFSKVAATVKNMPDREIDLLDCDDVYEYLGGMNAFVRAYGRKDAVTMMGDGSDPKKARVRDTRAELQFVFRSKVLNPKFIGGLMEHGYRGAAEMANLTEYTMAWGATSDVAEDWMYEGLADKFLLDGRVREWMDDVNPYAAMNILNRLQEAIERGLWNATDEYRERLGELYLETEGRIEEVTDRRGAYGESRGIRVGDAGGSPPAFLLFPLLHVPLVLLRGAPPPYQDAQHEGHRGERRSEH